MRANPGPGFALALLASLGVLAAGCVRRTITISTEPPGAMVWLNDREVGRSPVDVDFDFYGTYDVRLEREGYEPQMTSGDARAPWWDNAGLDLVAAVLPFQFHSRVQWHYALEPIDDDPEALTRRARSLRSRLSEGETTPAPGPPASRDDDDARP